MRKSSGLLLLNSQGFILKINTSSWLYFRRPLDGYVWILSDVSLIVYSEHCIQQTGNKPHCNGIIWFLCIATNFIIMLDKIRSCICYSRCSSSVRDHLPACSKQQPHPNRDYYKIKRSKNRYIWAAAAAVTNRAAVLPPGLKLTKKMRATAAGSSHRYWRFPLQSRFILLVTKGCWRTER